MATLRVVTAHIPTELAERVDALSERLDRPRGWVLREALEQYVDLERQPFELTREALAEVTAGRVSTHEEVEAWAATLRQRTPAPTRSRRRR